VKRWFDRSFSLGRAAAEAPELLARLRRTPDRLAAALESVSPRVRVYKPDGRWSIQEHAGHLLDLEELWFRRLDDFEQGREVLHPADLQNRRTHEAGHNRRRAAELLESFRTARTTFADRLAGWPARLLDQVAKHPRLGQPMSAVDLCHFVAEHDDHHLATAAEIATAASAMPDCALDLLNAVDSALPRLQGLGAEQTAIRPAPGKWSPREVIGHLIDSASNNHQRFVRAEFQDGLVFDGYQQDCWVEVQQYQQAPWPELLTLWASFNRHLARVMTAAPPERRRRAHTAHNFDRIAFRPVPQGSAATLEYFMEDYVLHLQHHLNHILDRVPDGAPR
jgi:uncharacterized damage-inducible protein DinB